MRYDQVKKITHNIHMVHAGTKQGIQRFTGNAGIIDPGKKNNPTQDDKKYKRTFHNYTFKPLTSMAA